MSSKYPDEKQALRVMFVDPSTTQPQLDAWLEDTIDHYRYDAGPTTWWQRNWFPLIMLVMMGGSMLAIGLVNGWS